MVELVSTRVVSVTTLAADAGLGALYAVLDACDEPRVPAKVRELGPELAMSLYRGSAESDLAAIAPYLVRVTPDVLRWITESFWGDPWGIFAVSDAPIEELRTHFRKFLLIEAPDGDSWYFRFYDPRVLAKWLPGCDHAQLSEFLGPVSSYAWTDTETYGVTFASQNWFEQTPVPPAKPRIVFRRQ
ncbi:MAG: DUF4123 domain-containing protein [Gemmatimonadota bacterium]